jgi:membrane protease YdiL (CAAX protease family)
LQRCFGPGRAAALAVVVVQAAVFGVGHLYLGARGVATATLVGLIFGAWYVFRSRNLWPLILAHGLTDTISLIAIAAGVLG